MANSPVSPQKVKAGSAQPSPAPQAPASTAGGYPSGYNPATTPGGTNGGFPTTGNTGAATLDSIGVYTGNHYYNHMVPRGGVDNGPTQIAAPAGLPEQRSASDLLNSLYSMPPDEVAQLQARLASANLLTGKYVPGVVDDATYSAYGALLVYTSRVNDPAMTPDKMLDGVIAREQASGGGAGPGGVADGTYSTADTSIDYTDPTTARGIVNDAMSRLLGRQATNDEISQFTAALHSAEAANPTRTNKSETVAGGRVTGSTTTTQQGQADPTQLAEDMARQNPQFGAYQAATTYMDAFMQALNGPVPGV